MNIRNACILLGSVIVMMGGLSSSAMAQGVVQLPTFRIFEIRTAVSVPDGGTMYLGGVTDARHGAVSRGVPGLANIPGANRLFKNRGIGREHSHAGQSVKADIIILEEYEREVMAEAERRQALRGGLDVETLKKADFITRNIGRNNR